MGQVYAPLGGKFEQGKTLFDITRKFYKETGLFLINPRLQGRSYWKDSAEGIIFIFTAENFERELLEDSLDGVFVKNKSI